ncbi:unnamed protein product [Oppiella nova]|uniref:Endoplasmic reticulum resident protein 29 n=1 Tax=Oppiella nova TaxID=334625 RepID=A0A7R9M658_9ACAR|nr:unnamed protein product [Oppiella nova]CAG2171496.1 unnamed protein product [Oppiella nova]
MRHLSSAVTLVVSMVLQMMSALDALSGSVVLDSFTFDKIVTKFKTSLVKFDIQYPYGEKHEEFEKVSQMAKSIGDIVMAEVGVQEFGEKQNMDLMNKYGITKDDFPVLKLFIGGDVENPIHFDDEFKSDPIIRFIRRHSGVRIPLENCLPEFDDISQRFMGPETSDRQRRDLLNESQQRLQELTNSEHKKWADVYIQFMTKVIEKGDQFIDSETQRLNGIVSQKLAENKRKEIKGKLNILLSFATNRPQNDLKSEL